MQQLLRVILTGISCFALVTPYAQKTKDTIFLSREFASDGEKERYRVVFIDTSRRSANYRLLSGISLDKEQLAAFKQSISKLKRHGPLQRKRLTGLPLRWVPLYMYKNKYYLYKPSDTRKYLRAWFTDSVFVENRGAAVLGSRIVSVAKEKPGSTRVLLRNENNEEGALVIHMIDRQRGIAVFENIGSREGSQYVLMVDVRRLQRFPVIVQYNEDGKGPEFTFDKIDFGKLVNEAGNR